MKKTTLFIILSVLLAFRLAAQTYIIPFNASWKYLDNGSDQGTAWRAASFSDASWKTGDGKFGYGYNNEATQISYGPDDQNKYTTTYFRKSFNIADVSAYASYTGSVLRDDGVVVYINGEEVYRNNMPTGSITYTTFALSASDDGMVAQNFHIPASAFVNGTNVIAVEVHQTSLKSFDKGFDLALTAGEQAPPTIQSINRHRPLSESTDASWLTFRATFSEAVTGVDATDFKLALTSSALGTISSVSAVGTAGTTYDISVTNVAGSGTVGLNLKTSGTGIRDADGNPVTGGFIGETYTVEPPQPGNMTLLGFNASWKYLDNGSDQGTAWRAASFSDGSWKTGNGKFGYGYNNEATQISYGPDDQNKYTTTYFRKSFNISDVSVFSSFVASVLRDDGMVVYVNGREVYRNNMPDGSITYTTFALSASDDGMVAQNFHIPASAFVNGTNVIAVEVHQTSLKSFDKGFDLSLTANDLRAPTVRSINRHQPSGESTDATLLTFRATFSEAVTGVDATDFQLALTSSALGTISGVSAVSSSTYDISITNVSGSGTLGLNLKSSNTNIRDGAGNLVSGGFTGQTYTIQQFVAETDKFASVIHLNPVDAQADATKEKQQAKVFMHAGQHWAIFANTSGTYLWRLDGTTWTKQLRLSTRNSRADCVVDGDITHVFMFSGQRSALASIEYVAATNTYQFWSRRNTNVDLHLEDGVETGSISLDATGRMWLASDDASHIFVRYSDAPYTSWSMPIAVATGIDSDDIGAVVHMPALNKIGVFWSNQNTQRFGFRTHTNGTDPNLWSADEVPASQSALNEGRGMADDHLNLKVASDGTVYAAVKTSYDETGFPVIALLIRRPAGTWDNLYEVAQNGTRPIVLLNESQNKLRVVYTALNNGGDILYKGSAMSRIAFGAQQTLISGLNNNVTSTHQNYSSEIVILASNTSQVVGVLASDNPTAGSYARFERESEIVASEEFRVYPNPFGTRARISFTLPADGEYALTLYDSKLANQVFLKKGQAKAGQRTLVEIEGDHLARGLYFLRLQGPTGSKTLRVVLNK